MVEAVLVKPPVLSKKFMNTFLDGISSIKNDFINPDNTCNIKIFGVFLQTRYFRFMGNTLKKKVFRSLWKFVFNLDNTECNENRTVNFYALECLYNSSKEVLKDYIKSEHKFFPMSNKYFTLECEFLLKNNEIFHFLSEDVQIAIKKFYARDTNMNTKILGAFLSVSIEKHCDNLENCFNGISPTQYDIKKSLKLLYEHANNLCKGFEVLRCFIRIFAQSFSYYDAEAKFKSFIVPYLSYMQREEIFDLINAIKSNRQIFECHYVLNNVSVIDNFAKKYLGDEYSVLKEIADK